MKEAQRGYVNIPFLFLLAATIIIGLVSHLYIISTTPSSQNTLAGNPVLVEIKSGWATNRVGQILESKGLIKSARLFNLLARFNEGQVKAGEYQLNSGLSPWQILKILQQGKIYLHKITIPEGYSLRQIADLLENLNLASSQEFIKTAYDKNIVKQLLGYKTNSLEGYLFPDTYHFARGSSTEDIAQAMVERFHETFNNQYTEQAAKLGLNKHEVVTLASLIEKETANGSERPLIASVYHNRLTKGVRLQCDPTVIYALEQVGEFDGNIRKKDLQLDSPYNTYRYKGLPPGPIANPGQASIHAALYPAESDYIYFVSRNDGTHKFSSSLKEHNNAVYKFQKRRHRRKY